MYANQKISSTRGNFCGVLHDEDVFGCEVAPLGDLDGDMVCDLAVGSQWDDDGGQDYGALWILFLNSDGTVKGQQKISATEGAFAGHLDPFDNFGEDLTSLGVVDGDGTVALAVSAPYDDDRAPDAGAVWVLFLNRDGTVKAHQKSCGNAGGFAGALDDGDLFGSGLASIGDLNGDGRNDLAVGASYDDDGGQDHGAVWILFRGRWTTDVYDTEAVQTRLSSSYPNPFNPRTTLRFDLPVGGRIHLEVFDVAGRLIRTLLDADLPAGSHQAVWDGKDERGTGVASGSYFARLSADGRVETVRMGLVR